MSEDAITILLVPTPDWGSFLLDEGPCRDRPPTADDHGVCPNHGSTGCPTNHCWSRWLPHRNGYGRAPAALVLSWQGRYARAGALRAAEALAHREGLEPEGKYVDWRQIRKDKPEWRLVCGDAHIDYRWGSARRFAKTARRWSVPTLEVPVSDVGLLRGSLLALVLVAASREIGEAVYG